MTSINGSSEYSLTSNVQKENRSPTQEELKVAKGRIYSLLFKSKLAKLAILPSILLGLPSIIMFVFSGRCLTELIKSLTDPSYDGLHQIFIYSMILLGMSILIGILKYIDTYCWMQCGSELSILIRKDLYNKLMMTEVTFFDINPIGGILTLLSEDAQKVQDSFGPTKGTQISNLATFFGGIIGTFVYSWKIGLIFIASLALIFVFMMIFFPFMEKQMKLKFKYLTSEMTIAEESISSIRTVRSFNREKTEIERFHKMNELSQYHEKNASLIITGFMITCMTIIWASILGNFYYAGVLINKHKDGLEVGDLLSIFGFLLNGSMSIIALAQTSDSESKAIDSGARIIKLTEYRPEIEFEGGQTIENFKGEIEFKNVSFKYPTRETYVLKNISFKIKQGQMGALVGHSGSGKSTCIQLIERFYDPTEGFIFLDGVDITKIDPRWIHRKIGLVSQEPVLFNSTIKENILYGKMEASDEEIIEVAKISNAYNFIQKLENGLNTIVGEKGSLLSGGQKQRIAIARAVIRNPIILMADEATSALDAKNEKKVQTALNKVMKNRTSVIVAHRLSTIKDADIIYVFESGEIKEKGNHTELLALKGFYYNLVFKQLNSSEITNNNSQNKHKIIDNSNENEEIDSDNLHLKEISKDTDNDDISISSVNDSVDTESTY